MTEHPSDAGPNAAAADAAPTIRPPRRRTNPLLLLLLAIIPVAVAAWFLYEKQVKQPEAENRQLNNQLVYNMVGRPGETIGLKLDERFTDADGDLLADPPKDPAQTINPPTIKFSYVATNDPDIFRERFKEFVTYLSKEIGRPVEYIPFNSPEEELRALMDGTLHVAGVNTGNMPAAVNQCGFVPFCNLGSEQGVASYQMQIIVPADSAIQSVSDLKGRELTLTEPGSNSGFKAPLVFLSKEHGLQPGRDFAIRYSGGHRESMAGIANGTFQAAAVAGDLLQRGMAEDPPLIAKQQFRVIYESKNFPTAGFGYVWNLDPQLAERVKQAFFSFEWKGTGVEKEFGPSNQSKFAPLNYKNDFAGVREIDDAIRSIHGADAGASTAPTTAPATTQAGGT